MLAPGLTWKLRLCTRISPLGVTIGTFSNWMSSASKTCPFPLRTTGETEMMSLNIEANMTYFLHLRLCLRNWQVPSQIWPASHPWLSQVAEIPVWWNQQVPADLYRNTLRDQRHLSMSESIEFEDIKNSYRKLIAEGADLSQNLRGNQCVNLMEIAILLLTLSTTS